MANNQQVAVRERMTKLSDHLVKHRADFEAVISGNADKFMRMVQNAIIRDPEIADASMQSVYLEVQKAAADGLMLDGREATLTRFKVNKKYKENGKWVDNYVTEVAYIPMVAGIMKRVRNSGEVKAWSCELVYEEEINRGLFKYSAAPEPMIFHEPIIIGKKGKIVAAYSAVKLRDGSYHYEVMNIDQLNAIMERTKSRKKVYENGKDTGQTAITGPWATDKEEMYRKTVIRRHSKRLPVSSELLDVTRRVDSLYDFEQEAIDAQADEEAARAAAKPKPKSAASAMKALTGAKPKQQAEAQETKPKPDKADKPNKEEVPPHDEETGELTPEEDQTENDNPPDYEPEVEEVPETERRPSRSFDPDDDPF